MTVWLALAVAVLFAAAAWLAIWSRRGTWARPAAIVLFLIGLPVIAAASVHTLGHHRPINLAWELGKGEYLILGVRMVQDKAIYLYLETPDRQEPWPLVLPWDNETANQIQKAMDGAEGQGDQGEGKIMMNYDPSLDDNPLQFHHLPVQKALPDKPRPQAAPHFEQPGG
jgi:hypothetical protein